jgi:hypothetical protein
MKMILPILFLLLAIFGMILAAAAFVISLLASSIEPMKVAAAILLVFSTAVNVFTGCFSFLLQSKLTKFAFIISAGSIIITIISFIIVLAM